MVVGLVPRDSTNPLPSGRSSCCAQQPTRAMDGDLVRAGSSCRRPVKRQAQRQRERRLHCQLSVGRRQDIDQGAPSTPPSTSRPPSADTSSSSSSPIQPPVPPDAPFLPLPADTPDRGAPAGGRSTGGGGGGGSWLKRSVDPTKKRTPVAMTTAGGEKVVSAAAFDARVEASPEDAPMPLRVASHLYCSMSVRRSPSEIVNLLLSSCRDPGRKGAGRQRCSCDEGARRAVVSMAEGWATGDGPRWRSHTPSARCACRPCGSRARCRSCEDAAGMDVSGLLVRVVPAPEIRLGQPTTHSCFSCSTPSLMRSPRPSTSRSAESVSERTDAWPLRVRSDRSVRSSDRAALKR